MYLIDGPYVSEFLKNTIVATDACVLDTSQARHQLQTTAVRWSSLSEWIETTPGGRLYTNSESALAELDPSLPVARVVGTLKDKLKFRRFLKDVYPGFRFEEVSLQRLRSMKAEDLFYPCVIKPAVGFFSAGVHVLETPESFAAARDALLANPNASDFPKSVLDLTQYIVEDYIVGEEYAADLYVNAYGEVVLLNLLHHRFSSSTDTSDRIYTTSLPLLEELGPKVTAFLQPLADKLAVSGFPAHAEFRINGSGQLNLIEINPLRFGGWCTTGDMLGVVLGFNAYDAFMNDKQPDWRTVFAGKEDRLVSIAVLDNNSDMSTDQIQSFDYARFRETFSDIVELRRIDFKEHGFFGFAFLDTDAAHSEQLDRLLRSNLGAFAVS